MRQLSHLLQMRGLKHNFDGYKLEDEMSHLLQMRGLKREQLAVDMVDIGRIFYRCVD